MPANVESMFSVKETPWHGLGHVIQDAPNVEEGIKLAGLDWTVNVTELQRKDGTDVSEFARAFVRSDNGMTLGIVGPNTHPLQNRFAFKFFQPFLDAKEATLETAGSLDEGRKVWVMGKICRKDCEIVKGDKVAKFVLLSNSHDGTTAVRVGFTPIRVVCANTLAMAHGDKASKLIRVRHSQDVETNLEKIQDIMNVADAEFEATAEQFRFLATRDINHNDLAAYVKEVFEFDPLDAKMSTRSRNILQEILDLHKSKFPGCVVEVLSVNGQRMLPAVAATTTEASALALVTENLEAGRGTELPGHRASFWTAYNAVNEYLNYKRGHNERTRLNSLWFGENQRLNAEALKIALRMADNK